MNKGPKTKRHLKTLDISLTDMEVLHATCNNWLVTLLKHSCMIYLFHIGLFSDKGIPWDRVHRVEFIYNIRPSNSSRAKSIFGPYRHGPPSRTVEKSRFRHEYFVFQAAQSSLNQIYWDIRSYIDEIKMSNLLWIHNEFNKINNYPFKKIK